MRLLLFAIAASAVAQSAPRFEVASIRACNAAPAPGRKGGGRESSPDRLFLPCQTVLSFIQWAFVNFGGARFDPMASVPISGGPAWINTDRYQIDAKAAHPETRATLNGEMLRALLTGRFGLKLHRETRQVPVYALTVAKSGAKLRPARPGGCVAFDPDHPLAIRPANRSRISAAWPA